MSLCSCHYVSATCMSLCYAVQIGDININITLYFAFAWLRPYVVMSLVWTRLYKHLFITSQSLLNEFYFITSRFFLANAITYCSPNFQPNFRTHHFIGHFEVEQGITLKLVIWPSLVYPGCQRLFFFWDWERDPRWSCISEAQSAEKKKITSGHTYPEPHFRASNWDRICPSSLIGCAKETIPVIG